MGQRLSDILSLCLGCSACVENCSNGVRAVDLIMAARAAQGKEEKAGVRPTPALHAAMNKVLDIQTEKLAIPRRFTAMMKEIWLLQPRLEQRSGKRPFALLEQDRFRAGFDFLGLRAASGEVPQELFAWWETFQNAAPEARAAMLIAPQPGEQRTRRRRRRRKPSAVEIPGVLSD